MSNSSLVSYTKISPYRGSRNGHKIDTVSIHCVVGQAGVEALGSVFQTKEASAAAAKRVAYFAGSASKWYVRDMWSLADSTNGNAPYYVDESGMRASRVDYLSKGIRPIMIFDSEETLVDDDYNIIT